jgi:hypothetical protein
MSTNCLMCNKPASTKPHLYPGPLRVWMYAPSQGTFKQEGGRVKMDMMEVDLHTPCVGSFLVMNKDKDLLLCLKPGQ